MRAVPVPVCSSSSVTTSTLATDGGKPNATTTNLALLSPAIVALVTLAVLVVLVVLAVLVSLLVLLVALVPLPALVGAGVARAGVAEPPKLKPPSELRVQLLETSLCCCQTPSCTY
jgi:uncharacterized membrane protein